MVLLYSLVSSFFFFWPRPKQCVCCFTHGTDRQSLLTDLDVAHLAGWEPHNLHDLEHVAWVGSVLDRSCTIPVCQTVRLGSRLSMNWSLSGSLLLWCCCACHSTMFMMSFNIPYPKEESHRGNEGNLMHKVYLPCWPKQVVPAWTLSTPFAVFSPPLSLSVTA